MLSIQQADRIAKEIADEFGVPPPPAIYVTSNLPSQYAGAYYHNGEQHIKIRPEYFTERTIAHEVGHYIFHTRAPGVCQGQNPECEEVAQMIERWWIHKRRSERTLIDGKLAAKAIRFTLNQPMSLSQAKRVAQALRESEIGESVDRIGFQGRQFYVVMKPTSNMDGQLIIGAIIAALAVVGVGILTYSTSLFAPGPLGLPNLAWILFAGAALVIGVAVVLRKK